jgi:hypothetical protein
MIPPAYLRCELPDGALVGVGGLPDGAEPGRGGAQLVLAGAEDEEHAEYDDQAGGLAYEGVPQHRAGVVVERHRPHAPKLR